MELSTGIKPVGLELRHINFSGINVHLTMFEAEFPRLVNSRFSVQMISWFAD
jgi:hypothetical protein